MRLFHLIVLFLLVVLPFTVVLADDKPAALTADAVNAADLATLSAGPPTAGSTTGSDAARPSAAPDPAIVKLQILLDRAGASPGVIDGLRGDNLDKAIAAFETMSGVPADGRLDADLISRLPATDPTPVTTYTITDKDLKDIGPPVPDDYAQMAKLKFLGYARVSEELAERFHMDEDLLKALNPEARWQAGEAVAVADPGKNKQGKVARIEADKSKRQVRAYDADGRLLVAYPATIGSQDNPSPSGTHLVNATAELPTYTYDPTINFKQGDNTERLVLPPGPNGPVGSVWIDLTEPTFGIHGTAEPSEIDKTNSHGCIRLTNWDAEELAKMVEKGVPVEFIG